MKIWIINPYGNIPGEGWRDYRSTLIAKALAEAGHETVWWVSNFEHRSKTFRTPSWADIQVNPKFRIKIVPSTSYTAHISLKRIRYEISFARNLYERALKEYPPDIIILTEPALFVSPLIIKLVKRWKTKLVIDILDLWPELFHIALPSKFSKLGRFVFFPLYMRRAALFKRADAIVAVTKDYLDVAQRVVIKAISEVIYLGVDVNDIQTGMHAGDKLPEALSGILKAPTEVWAIYAGTLGSNYDIHTILEAADLLLTNNSNLKIIIAGDGPLKNDVISIIKSRKLKNIVYVGTLDAREVTNLYGYCDIALSTYIAGSTVSMPLKAYDYMAAGLPIVNSLDREFGSIIRDNNIGIQYEPQNAFSLASSIQRLVDSSAMREEMRKNATQLAFSFNEAVQHRKFVKIIERVAETDPVR